MVWKNTKNGFSIEYRGVARVFSANRVAYTKTEVITLANHNRHGISSEPIKVLVSCVADVKRGKTSATEL